MTSQRKQDGVLDVLTPSRRSIVRGAVASTVALSIPRLAVAQKRAPSPPRVLGANDRIYVAYVGTGSQGTKHIRIHNELRSQCNIVPAAVCDVYQKRLDRATQVAGLTSTHATTDYRRVLDRKDIDAVFVATTDPGHADIGIAALESGKHLYGEKPLARHLLEGFRLYDTVRKTKKVFQYGSQFCSDRKYWKVAEWIRANKLGPLVWAQGSYCRNHPKNSEWTYPIDPDASETNLDWARWLGPAPKIPFSPEHYFSWHKYYAYNSGILGNLLSHTFVPLVLATGAEEFPRRVVCTGTRKVSRDREITDTTHLLAEMPSGLTFCVAGSTVNEQGFQEIVRGHRATAYFAPGQSRVELKPERPFSEEVDPDEFVDTPSKGTVAEHAKNFFACIRKTGKPTGSIEVAIRAHTILCMAEMSERMGLALYFDDVKRQIRTGDGRVVQPLDYDTVIPPQPGGSP